MALGVWLVQSLWVHAAMAPAGSARRGEQSFQQLLGRYCATLARTPSTAPIPVKLGSWSALQAPSSSIMGIVLLGEGNTRTRGRYAAQLDKLYKYVAVAASKEGQAVQSHESWMLAFAILFLSEAHRVEPSHDLKARIGKLVKRLEAGRHGEKGWYHSLKSSNYGPFAGVTIWCAAALSAAQEQGVTVDRTGLATTMAGLRKSVDRTGGSYYYTYNHNSYSTPGRSAGVAWILSRYGKDDEPQIKLLRAFLVRHVNEAALGHATWMMNMGWSALGAASADETTRDAFWKVHRATIAKTRSPNAFFRVQKWTEHGFRKDKVKTFKDGKTWPDPMYGDAWATVWMFLVWQAEEGRCILTKRLPPPGPPKAGTRPTVAAIDEQAIIASIRKGKSTEVLKTLNENIAKSPNDARLYRLRAFALVPALLQPFVADTDQVRKGRNMTRENQAFRDLATALARKGGKGDISDEFDSNVRMLRAKVLARQTVASYMPNSTAWVRQHKNFANEVKGIIKAGPQDPELPKLVTAMNEWVRVKAAEPVRVKRRTVVW